MFLISVKPLMKFTIKVVHFTKWLIKWSVNEYIIISLGFFQVPNIGVIGSGGGFRAMTAYSGVFTALVDSHILDMTTYVGGLSGSAW